MACEYESYAIFEEFVDRAALEKALDLIGRGGFEISATGRQVISQDRGRMNELKQRYQTEAARAALKKKGFFVSEKKQENGKITLTVRA